MERSGIAARWSAMFGVPRTTDTSIYRISVASPEAISRYETGLAKAVKVPYKGESALDMAPPRLRFSSPDLPEVKTRGLGILLPKPLPIVSIATGLFRQHCFTLRSPRPLDGG
jgi:hypothetical protein